MLIINVATVVNISVNYFQTYDCFNISTIPVVVSIFFLTS